MSADQFKNSTSPPPPPPSPGIPRAFDHFLCLVRREFDAEDFPRGGEFDLCLWGGEIEPIVSGCMDGAI